MDKRKIIRAWRDAEFRSKLTEAERSMLPESPAGLVEISDEDLAGVAGVASQNLCTARCTLWILCIAASYANPPACVVITIACTISIEFCESMYQSTCWITPSWGCCHS